MNNSTGIPKLIFPANQEALFTALRGQFVQLIEPGPLRKAASVAIGADIIDRFKPPADHFLAHYIGVGDYERFGFNKNADAFSRESLERYTPTFVSHGHYFQEHNNSDPKKAIGSIKYAAYNPAMGWSELLVWGDRRKAERQYEHIKAGKVLASSMSCRVPEDRCSICENHAKTRADYCSDILMNAGKYVKEKRAYAFMWNDKPTFFDLSDVENPAERVARALGVWLPDGDGGMRKAASGESILSADMAIAAGVHLPDGLDIRQIKAAAAELAKLVDMEKRFEAEARRGFPGDTGFGKLAAHVARFGAATLPVPPKFFAKVANFQMPSVARLLAEQAAIMSFQDFSQWVGAPVTKEACTALPSMFRVMSELGSSCSGLMDDFTSSGRRTVECEPDHNDEIDSMMTGIGESIGFGCNHVVPRTTQVVIIKSGSVVNLAPKPAVWPVLADAYGIYKLASVLNIMAIRPDVDPEFLRLMAVAQNFVDPN